MSTEIESAWRIPSGPDVLGEVFDGEAVVVHLGTGVYYSFDAATTTMWSELCDASSLHDARSKTTATSPDEVDQLVSFLVAQGLAVCDTSLPDPTESWPGVASFTDMADLLVLDPIHDIDLDGSGWPVVEPNPAVR